MDYVAWRVGRPRRRDFLKQLSGMGLLMASLVALGGCVNALPEAPLARVPRVGYVSTGPPGLIYGAFRQGLHDLGYIEGVTVVLEHRWSQVGGDQLIELAADVARLPADVIVAANTVAAIAVKRATALVPIVMASSFDAVGRGLVASLGWPGGNVTGLTVQSTALAKKQLELLKGSLPEVGRVAVLWNPVNPSHGPALTELGAFARSLGMFLKPLGRRTLDELESAFRTMAVVPVDAAMVLADPLFLDHRASLVALAAEHRVATIYPAREFVDGGGLVAYGPDLRDLQRRAGGYVDKILKGSTPADLPVEQPTKLDFVINLRTARAAGLTIPPSILAQATEVIR